MRDPQFWLRRRLVAGTALAIAGRAWAQGAPGHPYAQAMKLAFEMKRRALAAGDQPYGAVVVLEGRIVGEGPSRVHSKNDRNAHAEREAIADARRRLGRADLAGGVLVSTSIPCSACQRAAVQARIARMIHGESLTDAGPPRP